MYYSIVNWQNRVYYLLFDEQGLCSVDIEKTSSYQQAIYNEESIYQKQLIEYFTKKRKQFDCPLHLKGTSFQQEVWQALQKIPFGQAKTYQDIAETIQRPKSCRAVGGAIGSNPVFIFVPCHRVIGKSGHLTGFSLGLDLKKELLDFEGIKYKE
ncbi:MULTISPECIES: methylated-DNA--[protein]-cysteine S-methyltransferase [unclassified Granulicatella]|uniref:methylated-DNA--[protein]-cysteine S-methyltransferase n=1 Tax=unclassified Granulicatella TaxID=2630493 RepID=UPI0010734FD2|nr:MULTISPECIES: methylated-DNA--[protein]-cysteine S-methyltransferase [unclassified Granulicatella]MBF0779725.1 methylated-DNA--[protein]-cysteine S-methyltransferase [Granulicatella sp. 19428wC4_WM01]TFU96245.1 methylated-DNA--[protein]-cysteine S-methyltransferase [Granulicatella sp. WM01]